MRDRTGKAILNEESGKRMIPDTILHYPDGKDAVIDSKVSLTAFVDYQTPRPMRRVPKLCSGMSGAYGSMWPSWPARITVRTSSCRVRL